MLQSTQYTGITYSVPLRPMPKSRKGTTVGPHSNNLYTLMERDGVTQADIARAWGVHNGDVTQRVKGRVRITPDRARVLAQKFGWTASEIYGEVQARHQIPLLGSVGAGEQVIPIDDLPLTNGLREHERQEMNCEFVDAPPGGIYRDMVALRVKGDSMEPYLSNGDIVYYNQVIRSGFDEYLNKRVIVALKDGRVFLKTLERGFKYGHYNLRSYNAKLIEDAQPEWCARVAFIKPA